VLGPLLFAAYCSPVATVITDHGVQYHQYADDTQLHLGTRANNTAAGLSVLAACTADVRQWYLQLNSDKSEVLAIGTTQQLHATFSAVSSVSVAGVDLPTADKMKVLGVVLDRRLAFNNHVTAMARSCNYHAHTTLADDGARTDVSMQYQQHPEASTSAEQCLSDRPSGAKAIRHQVTTPPAAYSGSRTS